MTSAGLARLKDKENLAFVLTSVVLAVFELYSLNYLRINLKYLVDSDMASEMILSRLVFEQGKIIPDNWYYSTEIRILNTELVFAPLFLIFTSWHRIRLVGTAVLHFLLILGSFTLCRSMEKVKMFPFLSLMLLLPVSEAYYFNALKGAFYIPYIVISLFALTLVMTCMRSSGGKSVMLITASAVFALASSLNGPREILCLYLPLLLSAVTVFSAEYFSDGGTGKDDKYRKLLIISAASMIGAGAGYLINQKYLAVNYDFDSYEIWFKSFNGSDLCSAANGFFSIYGYTEGPVDLYRMVSNALAVCITLLILISVIYGIRNRKTVPACYYVLSVFSAFSYAVFILFFTYIDKYYVVRFNIPVAVTGFILIALFFSCVKKPGNPGGIYPLYYVLVALMITRGLLTLDTFKKSYMPGNEDIVAVSELLREEGYTAGFAEFWSANVVTELTDGKVDMYCFDCLSSDQEMQLVESVNQTHKWLQLRSHDQEMPEEGRVCIILTEPQYENCRWKPYLTDEYLIYSSEGMRVYGFEDYQTMIDVVGDYRCDYFDDDFLINAVDEDGVRTVFPGGLSCGPYITYYEGLHRVTITGENLLQASFLCTSFNGEHQFPYSVIEQTDTEVILEFYCDCDHYKGEVVINNDSEDMNVMLTGLSVEYVLGS